MLTEEKSYAYYSDVLAIIYYCPIMLSVFLVSFTLLLGNLKLENILKDNFMLTQKPLNNIHQSASGTLYEYQSR